MSEINGSLFTFTILDIESATGILLTDTLVVSFKISFMLFGIYL